MNKRQKLLLAGMAGGFAFAVLEAIQARAVYADVRRDGFTARLETPFGLLNQHIDISDDKSDSPSVIVLPPSAVAEKKRMTPVSVGVGVGVAVGAFLLMGD